MLIISGFCVCFKGYICRNIKSRSSCFSLSVKNAKHPYLIDNYRAIIVPSREVG